MNYLNIFVLLISIISLVILIFIVHFILFANEPEQDINNSNVNIQVCVINLARRRDRMIEFSKHYSLPMKYTVEDAIDGYNLNEHVLHKEGILGDEGYKSIVNLKNGEPRKFHYELGTLGAVGCSLTHIRIWNRLANSNDNLTMVFEDDALVMGIKIADIADRLAELPNDWHIYMIGQPHTILEGIPVPEKKNLYKITRFCGTHAYIIKKEAAIWLLNNGKLFPINQQIDSHMSELATYHGLTIYFHLGRSMYGSFGGHSDIQTSWNTQIGRLALT